MLRWVEADRILVPAEDIYRIAANTETRTGDVTAVDGIAYGCIGGTRTFCAHIALGGESCHQIVPRGEGRHDSALRNGLLHCLKILGARMEKKMDMGVDETRHKSAIAKIKHLSPRGMLH